MNIKNGFLTLGLLLFFSANSFAQSDTLAELYKSYLLLYQTNDSLTKQLEELGQSVSTVDKKLIKINELDGKVANLNNDLNTNLEKINKLTEEDFFSKQTRLKGQKSKIVNTATFVGYSINSFNAIDQAFAQTDYMTDISSLNNPNNTELGFSLSEEITELLESKIIKGDKKFNGKKAEKFLTIAKNVVEDPFVSAFTSSVPGLSAIEGVLGLVTNVVVKEDAVSVEDYKAFKEEMQKFINHYKSLSKAESNLTSNLGNLEMRLEALRTVIDNYALERVKTIYPDEDFSGMNLNQVIAKYYTPLDLERYISNVFNEYNGKGGMNYTAALADERLVYPFYAINQAQFIKQELEALNNEYISSYRNFQKSIRKVLLDSKSLTDGKDSDAAVDKKVSELDEKLSRLIATFEKSVAIENVVMSLNEIPTF